MNEPIDHHYLPIFYLSRWTGSDERLCRFSRPYGTVLVPKRIVPRGTAFEERLYDFGPTSDGIPLSLEHSLLSKIDSDAAVARDLLESQKTIAIVDKKNRESWSKFLIAQMLRAPEDIEQLKHSVRQEWDRTAVEIQYEYEKERSPLDPKSVSEFIDKKSPDHIERLTHQIAERLLVHNGIAKLIAEMHWSVMEFSNDCSPLFTSDRPVWMTTTLTESDAFMWMPISPRALFVAAPKPETVHVLLNRPRFQSRRS